MSEQQATVTGQFFADHGRRLSGWSGSGPYAAGGVVMMLFAVPFLIAGSLIFAVGAKWIEVDPGTIHAPMWVIEAIGACFALAGLSVFLRGLKSHLQASRLSRHRLEHPDQPWLSDFNWDASGCWDLDGGLPWKHLLGALFIGLFLAPFHYLLLYKIDDLMGRLIMGFVVGIFDLVLIISLGYWFYLVARYLKFGRSRLVFEQFPFKLGQVLEARLEVAKSLGAFERLAFTLRCIRERLETHGSGRNRSQSWVRYERYADEFVIDEPGQHQHGEGLPVTFLLPDAAQAGGLASALRGNPPTYWEIEVNAKSPGVDYHARFRVPVYGDAKG